VQYMYNGALTIQRLVDDFIIHDTGAKDKGFSVAENGVSFVNFPVSNISPCNHINTFNFSYQLLIQKCLH